VYTRTGSKPDETGHLLSEELGNVKCETCFPCGVLDSGLGREEAAQRQSHTLGDAEARDEAHRPLTRSGRLWSGGLAGRCRLSPPGPAIDYRHVRTPFRLGAHPYMRQIG
jgi:hypothetical protein